MEIWGVKDRDGGGEVRDAYMLQLFRWDLKGDRLIDGVVDAMTLGRALQYSEYLWHVALRQLTSQTG